jgi:PTH1 family peptidyl-tRNA hydrolase
MIIVGLGNPGKEYEKTRHNVGFMFVDELAKTYNLEFKLDKKHEDSSNI